MYPYMEVDGDDETKFPATNAEAAAGREEGTEPLAIPELSEEDENNAENPVPMKVL